MKIEFPSVEAEELFDKYAYCPKCKSHQFISVSGSFPQVEFTCGNCEKTSELFEVFEDIILESKIECPECGSDVVIQGVCFDCGFELDPERDYEREKYIKYQMDKND